MQVPSNVGFMPGCWRRLIDRFDRIDDDLRLIGIPTKRNHILKRHLGSLVNLIFSSYLLRATS